jgi:hypothetical protein
MREKGFIQVIKKIYLVETKVSRQISKFVLTKFQVKNEIPNLKTIKQMLPVPNVLLDCVI